MRHTVNCQLPNQLELNEIETEPHTASVKEWECVLELISWAQEHHFGNVCHPFWRASYEPRTPFKPHSFSFSLTLFAHRAMLRNLWIQWCRNKTFYRLQRPTAPAQNHNHFLVTEKKKEQITNTDISNETLFGNLIFLNEHDKIFIIKIIN